VVDKTGLADKYDFTLEFQAPERGLSLMLSAMLAATLPQTPGQPIPVSNRPPDPAQEDGVPIISSALEKQLGLKLEKTKTPLDVLVIDHVEKIPTDN
jgi:uncharacterized protein (TIGR03435 family)